MTEWQEVQLGDIFEVNPRRNIKRGETTPFVPMEALEAHVRRPSRIDEREFTGSGTKFQNGDTLLARITPCLENGKTAFITDLQEGVVGHGSTEYIVITGKPNDTDCLFAYYLARSPDFRTYAITHMEGTSGRQRVPSDAIEKYPFLLPPFSTQRAIARILGDLDDKIELNRQINQTLEQMAQAIFKSCFVDFEPVKAKIEAKTEGRDPERAAMCAISGKTDAELDQLPPEQRQQLAVTAALFPDEMVESELGLIPKGWQVKSLPEAIEVNPPRILKKKTIAPYLDMANVPTNTVRATNVISRVFSSGSKFMNGDTLLARITPCLENGKTAYVDFLAENQVGWGSTEFIVFRSKAPLPEAFGYLLCRLPEFRAFAIANMSGTSGRQRVPNNCFENYLLAVPDFGIASAFGDLVGKIMYGIKAQDEESKTLATLRDSLLPKLLSGELSVTTADEMLKTLTA